MRLSDFAPRLNGIVQVPTVSLRGLGDATSAINVIASTLQSFLASLPYAMEHGQATPPDQVLATFQYMAGNACNNATVGCDVNSPTIQSAIQSAYQTYLIAYNTQAQVTAGQVASGSIVVPSTYVPNVLVAVAPITGTVQTNQGSGNVLAPPPVTVPVTSGQVLNAQTQGGSVAIANGTSGANVNTGVSSALSWLTAPISASIPIPLWMALAGGVVAFMVMSKK